MTKTEQSPELLDEQDLDAVVGGAPSRSQCEPDDGHPSGGSSGGSGGDDDDIEVPDTIVWDIDGGS